MIFRQRNDGEAGFALIYVRGKNSDTQGAGFGDGFGEFVGISCLGGQERGHVLDGVVGFDIGCPVGDDAVAGGVGFVEAVSGEGFDLFEEVLSFVMSHPVGDTTVDEFTMLLLHLLGNFLANGFPEFVSFFPVVTGQINSHIENVILISDDPVTFVQKFLHSRVKILNQFRIMFSGDIIRN